ncbi:N-acetylneuraminate epimerase [Reinekea sp.]|jgi:N-acetylneuraminate epimerase|uniref:N-acetylneuraminate epimerase n=1 Tax=Reinekea sp. TaxID=1970455 RepID=UPI0039896CE7
MINVKKRALTALVAGVCVTASMAWADSWQDLPEGFKSGIGVQVGQQAFVGLGSLGQSFYHMDLESDNKQWRKAAKFIGPATSGAAAAMADGDVYVFGGSGKVTDGDPSPVIFEDIYKYDTSANKWQLVESKTPKGLLGAQAFSLGGGKIGFLGGYNKNKFDKYLYDVSTTDRAAQPEKWQAIVDDFMGMDPEGYEWNRQVLMFDTASLEWSVIGESPYLPNCGSATVWNGQSLEVISGEIKPGLRTDMIKSVSFTPAGVSWKQLSSLPAPKGQSIQEGVAGAFAGIHNEALIVSGGANFHGARDAAAKGQWFAHNGFPKAFNAETYVRVNGQWQQVNSMTDGLAYGATFTTSQGLLYVGGEDAQRNARGDVVLVQWNGKDVVYTD